LVELAGVQVDLWPQISAIGVEDDQNHVGKANLPDFIRVLHLIAVRTTLTSNRDSARVAMTERIHQTHQNGPQGTIDDKDD
jgi:hypothetical protein